MVSSLVALVRVEWVALGVACLSLCLSVVSLTRQTRDHRETRAMVAEQTATIDAWPELPDDD